MDLRVFFGAAASVTLLVAFLPYFRDLFRNKTKPHIYTWLVWSITQGTAFFALLYGQGGIFAGLGIASGAILTMAVFLLSFKYGTKNITIVDSISLAVALLAVLVWWQLNNPILAVLMVAAIDGIGYLPTYRKSWTEPRTETMSFWILFIVGNVLALLAVTEYNFLTTGYLLTVIAASVILVVLCLFRRRRV